MQYSKIYASIILAVLVPLLPKIGVTVGSDELSTFVATLVAIVIGFYGLVQRYRKGDVNIFGFRK